MGASRGVKLEHLGECIVWSNTNQNKLAETVGLHFDLKVLNSMMLSPKSQFYMVTVTFTLLQTVRT